ncbi:hypothetical protein B0F90DRAFT_970333 [Multifurca ochricompacta]|uniref:Uncharacterized protein n=1 Tax=Multifurca ochricompacta TaxID=376703 RepID=A0AAD4M9Y4_9AGAM|nr:hypothetical protein B0F90DRAFT_970333 [Multifurca ochricompacta]
MAHYSSLFTMGLLSERASPPSSPKSNIFNKFRKSSLPTRALSKPLEKSAPSDGLHALPQFTNPFSDSPNSHNELRSFLSLDLAAEKSLMAHRSDKVLSPLDMDFSLRGPLCSANLSPGQRKVSSPSSTWHHPVPTSPHSLTSARRGSRDSLRTLPSPRPAPSVALPEIPSCHKEPRPLPTVIIPSPSSFPFSSSSSFVEPVQGSSAMSHQHSLSAPPTTSCTDILTPSPISPKFPPFSPLSPRCSRHASFMSFSSTSTSIRTTRRRNAERSNALACLEGRSRTSGRIPRSMRHRNFMSMSDDEDEEVEGDTGEDGDVEDDSDVSKPLDALNSSLRVPIPVTVSTATTNSHCPIDEEEDRVLPVVAMLSPTEISTVKPKTRSRCSTLESWLPLVNFIDLKDDELPAWRGIVEIVSGL